MKRDKLYEHTMWQQIITIGSLAAAVLIFYFFNT